MDEHIQHDPRTKQQIKDILYQYLYKAVLKQFDTRLEALVIKNAVLQGYSHKSVTYKGEMYSFDNSPMPRKMNRLHPSLKQTMDDYLSEIEQLNKQELPLVLGFITQVLNSSTSLQDYLAVLPSSVHGPIENLILHCPCRACNLSTDAIKDLQESNKKAIILLKQRLAINLLI